MVAVVTGFGRKYQIRAGITAKKNTKVRRQHKKSPRLPGVNKV